MFPDEGYLQKWWQWGSEHSTATRCEVKRLTGKRLVCSISSSPSFLSQVHTSVSMISVHQTIYMVIYVCGGVCVYKGMYSFLWHVNRKDDFKLTVTQTVNHGFNNLLFPLLIEGKKCSPSDQLHSYSDDEWTFSRYTYGWVALSLIVMLCSAVVCLKYNNHLAKFLFFLSSPILKTGISCLFYCFAALDFTVFMKL